MNIRRNYSAHMRRLCTMLTLGMSATQIQACASGKQRYVEGSKIAAAPHAALNVTNYSTEALRVYLVSGGVEAMLGTVASLGTRMFQVPMPLGLNQYEYRLVARTRSGVVGFQSTAFSISPGQIARWMLSPMQGAVVYIQ